MRKLFSFCVSIFIIGAFFASVSFAQLTGIKTIPGNYATITAAITDLNTQGVGSGGVTFNVTAGFTETASGLVITATGTTANPIVFQKSGSGSNPLITAGVGVGTMDGIILLSGADYVTFNAIDLQENSANTTTTTQMEWGYALLKVDGTNGSQNNEIKNCVITLNKVNTSSKGIYIANHTTASATSLTVTAFSGTNSANRFNGNTIQNCYIGINLAGYSDASPYAYYDHYNQIGYDAGNIIRYFGGSSATTYGIYTIYQDSLAVNNNNISGGTGTTTTEYGIMISTANNASVLVYNNTISDTTSTTTSSTYGISLSNAGASGTDNTVIVKRNTVQGMTSTAATSASLYGYYIYYTTAVNLYIDSNQFVNNKWGGATQTTTGSIYGFYLYPYTTAPLAGSVEYITNNYIAGNRRTQSVVGAGTLYGMYIYYGNQTVNVNNNVIENDTLASTTSTSYYFYVYNYYSSTVNYYNNIVKNIYRPNGATGTLYGFYISNAAYNGTFNFYNNSVNNFKTAGNSSGAIYGIYNTSSAVTKNMYGNNAYSLYTNAGGSVYGIYNSSGTTVNIYKNSVYDLRTSTGFTYGLTTASGTTVNVYNNFVSDLRCDSTSSTLALMGLYISGGTTVNAYYNTVYLNAVSTGTLFGCAAAYVSSTPTVDLRNNIFVNMSTPGLSGGYATAYYRSSSALTTYSSLSNNNAFYSGNPDTNHIIYFDGTNYARTLQDYKILVGPRDNNSVTENPPFINVSSTPYNLRINAAIATQLETTGQVISAPISIVDDFDGQARYPNAGYPINPTYPPTAPDIGADEFGGIPKDVTAPTIAYTALFNTPLTTARTLTATITDLNGVPTSGTGLPVLYWKINTGSYMSNTATSLGSNQYQFTFGAGVATGDSIYYYICAQDLQSPPNVGSFPSAGASGFTYNPPAASTPPTTPSTYKITAAALSGDYTVGVTMFNKITGKNITFQKVVNKVMKQVLVEDPIDKNIPGKNDKVNSETSASSNAKGRMEFRLVDEISWVPMDNGKVYDGPLYIKKSENPNYAYPSDINGIYATLTAAVADLNLRGVGGATRFLLTDTLYSTGETFPLRVNIVNVSKPTAVNTVTFKPNTGVNAVITGAAAATQIIRINDNYVTIDGSNVASGTTRNLIIQNTSITTPSVIFVASIGTTPITNVTVKNSTIINGVTSSSSVIIRDSSGTAGYFNNITMQNNSLQMAYIGFYFNAALLAGNGSGTLVTGNDLNTTTAPVRLCKVYFQGVDGGTVSNNNIGNDSNGTDASNITGVWFATGTVNSTISGNTISNIYGYGPPRGLAISSAVPNANITISGNTISNLKTAYSAPPYGIYVFSTTSGVSIKKNKIGNLLNTNTGGYGCRGINIATSASPANIDIVNNFVWNIVATSDASVTYWGIGIALDAVVSNINVYANSVNLFGTYAGYNSATGHAAFYIGSGVTLLDARDNIFVNSFDNTTSTTDISYSIYCAATNAAFTDINYNDYYVSGTPGMLGYLGAAQSTLALWRTATGKDLNSVNGDPKFIDSTNLHINPSLLSPVNNAGQFIATVTDDIDGNTRSTTVPDIGADEYTFAPVVTQSNYISVSLPQIMSCGGSTRLPVVYRATINGLSPNALYRYYSNGGVYTDLGTTGSGAGNPMFMNPDSSVYRYTSSVSLTTSGGYDVFRTNGSGSYTGWFSIVNTANTRFAAGKYIIPTVVVGDSTGSLLARFAMDDSIKVVNFSTNAADTCATAIYGISVGLARNIVATYDNVDGTGKPLSQTYLESEGVTVASSAPFYTTNVDGQNGRWGTVIPNINTNGVRRVEQKNLSDGTTRNYHSDADGVWPSGVNTVNPIGGLTPLALIMTDAPFLGTPVLVSPANNSINLPTTVMLDWNTVTLATGYRVQLATDSAFTTIVKDTTVAPDSLLVSGLLNNQNYWWRVAGATTSGSAPFSGAFKFKTFALGLSLNLKVYLEGFWNGTTQLSDTVKIYLAASSSPYAFIDSQKVVLGTAGTVSPTFGGAVSGNYYIVVQHRNHLETWSRLPQAFVSGTPLGYDFTTDSAKAYGNNMKKVGSVWVLFGGDANQDGEVGATDVPIFISQFGTQGYLSCDFNGDEDVNAIDVQIFRDNFGLTKAVPTVTGNPVKTKKALEGTEIKKNVDVKKDTKETIKKNK